MTHMPIALLEDRNGEALDNWLARNPQIQYITRDRGRCFTEALTGTEPSVTGKSKVTGLRTLPDAIRPCPPILRS